MDSRDRPTVPGWLVAICCLVVLAGACGDAGHVAEPPASTAPPPQTNAAAETSTTTTSTPEPPAVAERAPWPTEKWPTSTPEDQGMDSGMLADLVDQVAADGGIDSVMVVRNGYVVLDTVVHPFPENTTHIIHSCTKSITATLIGIATDRGLLDVDTPVVEILAEAAPEAVDDLKAAMNVEDLLTMSTGLDCRDSYLYEWQGMREMQASEDWTAHVLALPMAEAPGTRFEYCNGASFLLSAILSEVTGMPASDFAAEALFGPLGITDVEWPAGPGGVTIGWGEMMLRPADMAKFGYLYLRNGEWDGEQLVPEDWIDAATSTQIEAGTLADGYGYQWWIDDAGYAMAQGFGGQHIIVIPEDELVVVFTAGLFGTRTRTPQLLTSKYVVPAVLSDTALPPDTEALARLTAAAATASSGPDPVAAELPEMAAFVDGVRYEFRANETGNIAFTLRFDDGTALIESEDVDAPTELVYGLDGRFVTDDEQVALRGKWRSDNTFVIEYRVVGLVEKGTIEFIFGGDTARVTSIDAATMSSETVIADRTA